MPALAATATTHAATALAAFSAAVLILLGGWLASYALACWRRPFGRCRRCHGTGHRRTPTRLLRGPCPRCDGTGLRLRLGRQLYNHLRQLRHDAL